MRTIITENATVIMLYVALAAALLSAAFIAVKLGYKKKVAGIAYALVLRAEANIRGTKVGQERKAQVVEWLHDAIPAPFNFFISESDIDSIIESAVQKMKSALKEATQK